MNLNSVAAWATTPPARCPRCGVPYGAERTVVIAPSVTPDAPPAWQGCAPCLAQELAWLRRDAAHWHQATAILLAARTALTQPVPGD